MAKVKRTAKKTKPPSGNESGDDGKPPAQKRQKKAQPAVKGNQGAAAKPSRVSNPPATTHAHSKWYYIERRPTSETGNIASGTTDNTIRVISARAKASSTSSPPAATNHDTANQNAPVGKDKAGGVQQKLNFAPARKRTGILESGYYYESSDSQNSGADNTNVNKATRVPDKTVAAAAPTSASSTRNARLSSQKRGDPGPSNPPSKSKAGSTARKGRPQRKGAKKQPEVKEEVDSSEVEDPDATEDEDEEADEQLWREQKEAWKREDEGEQDDNEGDEVDEDDMLDEQEEPEPSQQATSEEESDDGWEITGCRMHRDEAASERIQLQIKEKKDYRPKWRFEKELEKEFPDRVYQFWESKGGRGQYFAGQGWTSYEADEILEEGVCYLTKWVGFEEPRWHPARELPRRTLEVWEEDKLKRTEKTAKDKARGTVTRAKKILKRKHEEESDSDPDL